MSDKPITIGTGTRVKPTCPRCASDMIIVGRLTDETGAPVQFAGFTKMGGSNPMGGVRACYCNDCGELTLTLE
jgi:hypothetical protein